MSTHSHLLSSLIVLCIITGTATAGSINPPAGPVTSTSKPLAEIEPRTAVNATNTPGDSDSVFRIAQAGSYYLAGNLTGVNAKAGIEIAASGVTLDLGGFALNGVPGSLQAVVVVGAGLRDIAISNGSANNWGVSAIDTFAATQCEVTSIRASLNGGAGVRTGNQSVVRKCIAFQNAGSGISVQTSCIVEGCHAAENVAGGIATQSNAVVDGCVATGSGGGLGIDVFTGSTVTRCTASNFLTGIQTSNDCTITACTARSNAGVGISAGTGSNVTNCTAGSNFTDGIRLSANCIATGNSCRQNGVGGGIGAGIHATGADNRIEGNNCTLADTGIDVDTAGNIICRNTCSGNAINWDIASGNVCLVVVASVPGTAFTGNAGGLAPGSTDPNVNFTY